MFIENHILSNLSDSGSSGTLSEYSFGSPACSPISTCSSNPALSENSFGSPACSPISTCLSNPVPDDDDREGNNETENSLDVVQLLEDIEQVEDTLHLTEWPGFKLVGDNIDKNFRPSFQRYYNSTNSMHAFHVYAVQDRIDFSSYSDINPDRSIDVTKLLITKADINQFKDNAVVLLSRYVTALHDY